ncbi:BatD family protein [Bradyrhizobium sp. DOA1]|uniref:BatD family protein n=1 Tax=Bradyrhizobium sp. DOA1 TaxID=1126616 RepID=UPI00077C721E|nr:BatD family protein [Bradyrhizobium sp. DOA1]KYH01812.1 hypothetical protein SE91_28120 [Bradyrhizobium sp. DOA1]
MNRAAPYLLVSAVAALLLQQVHAQGAPEPLVRLTITPQRVVVGQQATLQISVLAPNYMTAPPELPGLELRNVVTHQLSTVNINDVRDGLTYAGVRFEYALYPQAPGTYAISGRSVRIRYAAEPPATRQVEIGLPEIAFEAFLPKGASELHPFVSASKLTVDQSIKRSSDQLKVGDAITRTITITAEGTPAMLLPPQTFASLDGLKAYPAQPVLEDGSTGRPPVRTATRMDSATYMIERPGRYSLPAVEIDWWNMNEGKIDRAQVDAVDFTIPGESSGGSYVENRWDLRSLLEAAADHWVLGLVVVAALAGIAWVAPPAVRRLAAWTRRRRAAYLASESWSFRQLRRARRCGPAAVYFRLLEWQQRFGPSGTASTLDGLAVAANDPELSRQIAALRNDLFAPARSEGACSLRRLIRHAGSARTRLRRRASRDQAPVLPQQINPTVARSAAPSMQKVAR